jgi:hypothetical protein
MDGYAQGGGGADSPGQDANGGEGIKCSITGTEVIYATGGGSNVPTSNADPGTGNGGRQGNGQENTLGGDSYSGGSGVVIVRFLRIQGSYVQCALKLVEKFMQKRIDIKNKCIIK